MMLRDNHLHTSYSDGKNTLREMAETAASLGYAGITFTDHVRVETPWADDYIAEIKALQKEFAGRLEIKTGLEAKITGTDGGLDYNPELREKTDVVLAAIHRVPLGGGVYLPKTEVNEENAEEARRCIRAASLKALENPFMDVLAHPFRLGEIPLLSDAFTADFCQSLANAAIKNGKYLEHNYSKYNGCVNESFWHTAGLKVWHGTDSHSTAQMRERAAALEKGSF